MSSIRILFREQFAGLIGKSGTARTCFGRAHDIAGRDMFDQPSLGTGLFATT
jgi:hypothetical protein